MNKSNLIEGEKVAGKSILHLLLLGAIKLLAGFITGMNVIIADAISTFADTLGLFASYIGLKLSRRNADEKFEYGYYKIETLAALLISIGVISVGFFMLRDTLQNFGTPSEAANRPFAITTTIISIALSLKFYRSLMKVGKKVNSLALIASAEDKKIDVFSGFIVLGSIVANYQQVPYVEDVVTIIFALIIFKMGISSSKESLFFLLDYWNDPILSRKIRKIFHREKDIVSKLKKLRLRRAGTFIFGEAFAEINPFADLTDLREELNILQKEIMDLNPYFKDFAIYTHISKLHKAKVAIPIEKGSSLKAQVAKKLSKTKAYLFATIRENKIKDFYIRKLKTKDKKPVELGEFLKNEKVDILVDNNLNSLIYYNLRRTHHILIYPNFDDIKYAKDTLSLLLIDT
ncbi:cation transporter [Candidatus Peregrinibacteria bacterium]|nr:cation transporter [Candidatus Peregrinibacteria bacterium]